MKSTIFALITAGILCTPMLCSAQDEQAAGDSTSQKSVVGSQDDTGQQQPPKRREAPGDRRRAGRRPGQGVQGASPAERLTALIKCMDKNGDGVISKDEAPERMKDRFDRLDANGDGNIDKSELENAAQKLMGRRPPNGAPGERRPGQPGNAKQRGDGPQREGNPQQLFKRLDKNGDGKLSKDEVPERLAERFEQIDLNGDGELDDAELGEMRKQVERYRPEMNPTGEEKPDDKNAPVEPKRPGRNGGK